MSDTEAKKHAASDRKLRKQRDDGSIPSAQDSSALFSTAAGLIVCASLVGIFWQELALTIIVSPEIFQLPFDEAREVAFNQMARPFQKVLLLVLVAVLGTAVVVTLIINKGVVFAMKPVIPDFKRVSATSGAKRIFGKRGWTELGVATVRLFLWLFFAGGVAFLWVPSLVKSPSCEVICMSAYIIPAAKYLVIGAIAAMIVFGAIDIIIQRNLFLSEQKMTDTELKRERKDQSGSPEIRKERERRKQEMQMGSSKKIPIKETTLFFKGSQGIIGINYAPPDQQLPLVTVGARSGEKADKLMLQIHKWGIPIMEDDMIVKNAINKGNGEMLDVAHFRAFAQAMARR